LKADWQHEYETWKKRPLRGRYVYLYADGVYLKAGTERDKTAVLVVLGVDEQGHKELLAMDEGYRESTASWSEVLRSLRERGLAQAPLLAIGDGALGLWAALDEIFPTTRHQRCWNHRALNVLDKLPKRLQPEMRKQLHALAEAPNRQECERRRDALCAKLRDLRQESAAACVERDWEDFVTLYDFPEEHWVHLRTSNPASTATKLTSTSSLFPSSPSPISNPPILGRVPRWRSPHQSRKSRQSDRYYMARQQSRCRRSNSDVLLDKSAVYAWRSLPLTITPSRPCWRS